MFSIVVVSDINDGDYITSEFTVSDEKFLFIEGICNKLKDSKVDYGVPVDDDREFYEGFEGVLTKEEIDWLYDVIPRDDGGYGRLEAIRFYVGKPTTLL
jgi:hypothetical protein